MPTLIFVHGACVRDAAWSWSRMVEPLADLHDDVAAGRRAIAAVDGPVVLLGHSYGGVVVTEAGTDDRVAQPRYLTSVMPDAG